ncbi:MAG: arabinosyltransferase domain-containing protein, partial [Acidimicrobiia bacterium]
AAVAHALAPVHQESYSYSFRPAAGSGAPAVAVLPLARSTPDALELSLPCDRPGSSFRSLTLDDWSSPDPAARALQSPLRLRDIGPGLTAEVGDGVVVVSLGDERLLQATIDHEPDCRASVEYSTGGWRLTVPGDEVRIAASGPRFAEARFDGPAATSEVSAITVTTRELGSSPTLIQWGLLIVALGSILVVVREVVARMGAAIQNRPRHVWTRAGLGRIRLLDVAVLGTLLLWILFLPPFFDDGWVVARSRAYDDYGGFSTIYSADAAVFPFGYWFQLLQHLWFGLRTAPFIMRLPVLLLGIGTWFGLRSVARSLDVPRSGPSTWLMGGVFVVGFGAWGSLRPEPLVAALVLASLALAIRFRSGERGWVLAAWIAVIALAVTTHPAGVIASAPAIASWRRLGDWARSDRESGSVAVASLLTLVALTLVLLFFDSNLQTTLESYDASTGHSLSVFDEPERYRLLAGNDEEAQFGTVIRRAHVGLMFVAAGAFLIRRLGGRRTMRDLAGWTLIVGLALLSLTPSKWPWHFGGLIAVAALVAALEFRRRDPGRSRLGMAQPAIVTAALVVVMAWAWSVPAPSWTAFDLRSHRWWKGAVNFFPVDLSTVGVWAGLAVVVSLSVWGGRRWWRRMEGWSVPAGLGILSVALVVSVTAMTFVLDVLRTDGWTFGRQNIEAALGSTRCGMGDEVLVPVAGSLHRLNWTGGDSVGADAVAKDAGFDGFRGMEPGGFPRFGINEVRPVSDLGEVGSWVEDAGSPGEGNRGSHRSQWHRLEASDDLVALMVMGTFGGEGESAIAVQWGVATSTAIEDMGLDYVTPSGYFTDWTLLTVKPPPGADRIRLLLIDATDVGWVASSAPLGLSTAPLAAVAAQGDSISVVPPLLLYTPCVETPAIERGIVASPGMMVLRSRWSHGQIVWPPAADTSTYDAALSTDRYFGLTSVVPPGELADAVLLVMSQEYLTGRPARANGEFVLDR